MACGGGPLLLEHYRELRAGPYGEQLEARDQFSLCSPERLLSELAIARREKVQQIALQGTLLNPTTRHAADLALSFLEAPEEARIVRARWFPGRSEEDLLVPLLRRVSRLEIDYPPTEGAARSLLREPNAHEDIASSLRWMRSHRIDPALRVTVGLPGEHEAGLLETLRRAYSLEPKTVRIRVLTVEPGSFLSEKGNSLGLQWDPAPPHRVICHPLANSFELAWMIELGRASAAGYDYWKRASCARRGAGAVRAES